MINAEVLAGTVIDNRYRLTRLIGKGSFGWVFEGTEEMAGQYVGDVAVKLLAPENDSQREMVLREIRALAGLTHEYIIAYRTSGRITEGTLAGTIFLVTELGEVTLSKWIRPPRLLAEDEAWTMGRGIALALAHIHARRSVHRDVKPDNVLWVDGRWKLGDFGLARAVEGARMSASGAKGTLRYMAPEVMNNKIGPATDVYALGVTLLRSLTGGYAHEGETDGPFMLNLMTKQAQLPPELPDAWRPLLAGCLEHDPDRRWTAAHLAEQLGPSAAAVPRSVDASSPAAEPRKDREAPPSSTDTTAAQGSEPVAASPGPGSSTSDKTRLLAWTEQMEAPSTGGDSTPTAELQTIGWLEAEPLSGAPDDENRVRNEPDLELKLVGLQPTEEQPTDEAPGTPPEEEQEQPAARPVNWRVWGVAAALVLLVSGGGLFAWRSGAIPGITQPVGSEVSGDQAPRLVPMIEDLTVLAKEPVEVRVAPRPNSSTLGLVVQGTTVTAIGKAGQWYKIQLPKGVVAWIHQSAFLDGGGP